MLAVIAYPLKTTTTFALNLKQRSWTKNMATASPYSCEYIYNTTCTHAQQLTS